MVQIYNGHASSPFPHWFLSRLHVHLSSISHYIYKSYHIKGEKDQSLQFTAGGAGHHYLYLHRLLLGRVGQARKDEELGRVLVQKCLLSSHIDTSYSRVS